MTVLAPMADRAQPRVCLLTETYFPVVGGGETQARLLAEGLVGAGFSVIILTRRSDSSLAKVERLGGITVHRLWPVGRGQLKKWGLLFSAFPKLVQLRDQYDLIFVSGFRIVGLTAVLVSKLLGKVCVLKADSQGEMSGTFFKAGLARVRLNPSQVPFRLFVRLRNRVLRQADVFSAITDDIAQELSLAGVSSSRIAAIPNSVDTSRFRPVMPEEKQALRQKLGLSLNGTVAVYTGRLVSYKGLLKLVEVWASIRERNAHTSLLLVGSGGLDIHNCEAALRDYVATHALQDSVRFTGDVSNVEEYLQASDIFVFPTEDDAFPSSLIEAMSCGLPAISTPVGAIRTLISDGRTGLLCRPGDPEGLRRALENLISDPILGQQLGQAARKSVEECYAATAVNAEYMALFRLLFERARRAP